jgi:hypothetical protein
VAESARWSLLLDAKGLKGGAAEAREALNTLQKSIDDDTKALGLLKKQMGILQKGTVVNVDAARQLKQAIDQKEASIKKATESMITLGGATGDVPKKNKSARESLLGFAKGAKDIPGPLGRMAGSLEKAGKAGGAAGARWLIAAGAVAGIGLAVGGAITAFGSLAFASANARREEALMLEAQVSLQKGVKDSAAQSQMLQQVLDNVAPSSAAGRDALSKLALQLQAGGLRGAALEQALESAGKVAAVQGDAAASAWAKTAIATGGNIAALGKLDDALSKSGIAQQAENKFYSFDNSVAKLKENVTSLFAGLNIEPLLTAFSGISSLFDITTESGRSIQALIGPLGQSLADTATEWVQGVKTGVQTAILWAVKFQIEWLKAKRWLKGLLPESFGANIKMGEILIAALAAGLGMLVVAAVSAAWPFFLLTAAVYGAWVGLKALWDLVCEPDWADVWRDITKFFSDGVQAIAELVLGVFDTIGAGIGKALQFGKDICTGLVDGIKSGVTWVLDAMRSLGEGAWKTFKGALGISSPSKVMQTGGDHMIEGLRGSLEAGRSDIDAAMRDLVDPTLATPRMSVGIEANSQSGQSASTQPSMIINAPVTITVDGAARPAETAAAIETQLRDFFTTLTLQIGAA